MKKITIGTILLILSATTFCQPAQSSTPLIREEYLTKSKTQKILGFILLGAGATTLIIISNGNTDLGSVGALTVLGTLPTLGSIPLFIACGRNKRKAMTVSTSLKTEKNEAIQQTGISFHPLPGISIKIGLQ